MTNEPKASIRDKTTTILRKLSDEERRVLTQVVKIEREFLHQKRPRVRDDLLKAVRQIVKGAAE